MHSSSKPAQDLSLHVLVVEHEPEWLARTCALLLDEGVDVSTARTATGLMERVSRLQPDVILMDVLMPGLETGDLARLAARCMSASPALVVHTRLLKPMVRRVVNVRAVYGLIPKTGTDVDFVRGFREVTDRLVCEMPTQVFVPRVTAGSMSGTYALKPTSASALVTTGG